MPCRMHLLDLTLSSPAENLACDEALLDAAETGDGPAVLRFWEAAEPFVVLGFANKLEDEVDQAACRARDLPILRRCTGGGTVVQGPGCLNYALVLKGEESGPLRSVTSTNCFVMQRHREVLSELLGREVTVEGVTDLAIDGLKFSGNAQRRRRQWLLFHGTFLYDFNLDLIANVLRMPTRQPPYRRGRGHQDFLIRLPARREDIQQALANAWQVKPGQIDLPERPIAKLVAERYGNEAWTRRC